MLERSRVRLLVGHCRNYFGQVVHTLVPRLSSSTIWCRSKVKHFNVFFVNSGYTFTFLILATTPQNNTNEYIISVIYSEYFICQNNLTVLMMTALI